MTRAQLNRRDLWLIPITIVAVLGAYAAMWVASHYKHGEPMLRYLEGGL